MELILDKPNTGHLYKVQSTACSLRTISHLLSLLLCCFANLSVTFCTGRVGGVWRLDAVRYRWTMRQCIYDRLFTIKKERNTDSGQWSRFPVKAQIIYSFKYSILCSAHGWPNVQGLYTLQSLQGLSPQFIADASLGHSWPHTRQEQEAVPHSANTAHCCLSFSAGLAWQKHPTRRCNWLPHWLAYCLTYMHPHSITLIPKTANPHGGSQGGFRQQCKWPQLRDALLQLLNLTSATLQVGWENLLAWKKKKKKKRNCTDFKPAYVV